MNNYCRYLIAISSVALSGPISACDKDSGLRKQMIYLESAGETIEFWEMVPGQIKSVKLPDDSVVGISATPAKDEKYRDQSKGQKFVPELVEIRIFDMSGLEPKETNMSWGGANSVQGFGGFTLNFLKPVCVSTGA